MEAIRTTCKSLKFCFAISWKASKLYTLIRFVSEILSPVLPIASAFLTSFIINIIASVTDRNIEELGLAIIMSLGLVLFKSENKITLLVTQKLYNLNLADRIILLEQELIMQGGKYATMYNLQNERQ